MSVADWNPVNWIFETAIKGVLGKRPLGDPFSPGQNTFGPFFERVIAAQQARTVEPGTLGTVAAPAAPQPIPERPPPKVVSTPPLIPAPAVPAGTPGRIPTRPPPSIPGLPGGPSIPDRIPGIPAAGTLARSVLQTIIRGGWAGLLFYPREAGRGSALCVETRYGPYCPPVVQAVPAAVPVPQRGPRRRGRRLPGTVAPPRRRDRGRVAQPAAPAIPRGRPVTISRPVVLNPPRVITRSFPPPRSLPPPGSSFPQPGPVAAPAPIPAARPVALPAAAALLIPGLASLFLGSQTAARSLVRSPVTPRPAFPNPAIPSPAMPGVGSIPNIANPPQLGRVELPGIGPSPVPLPALNPAALTALSYAPAQSAAQELDRQCRERAKRKRKKKREPRSVCYRGTFTETKKSTRKVRKEKIPCQ